MPDAASRRIRAGVLRVVAICCCALVVCVDVLWRVVLPLLLPPPLLLLLLPPPSLLRLNRIQMWARGELAVGQDFVHESIVGSKFVGRLEVCVSEEARKQGNVRWFARRGCECVRVSESD